LRSDIPYSIKDEFIKLPESLREHIERSRLVGKHIATIHNIDLYLVDLAIITHDLAKNLTSTELLDECKSFGIAVEAEYLLAPQLLHGPVAASWLENKHKVIDKSVIEAVQYHTTGYPRMGLVAKVVFLADKLDPEKIKRNPALESVFQEAELDLDGALMKYINMQIQMLIEQDRIIHPYSISFRNELMKEYLESN
jgi:predicted HD superfamily hydrolase involved in NAD metabolism